VLFGQIALIIIVLLFLSGSGSIIFSLVSENKDNTFYQKEVHKNPRKTKTVVAKNNTQSILLDTDIGDFFEDE
jgi:4-diphosphocytidyl-2C-methyl-D-erythritol kinase